MIHLKIFSKDKFATSVHNGTKSDLGWEIYPEGLGIILSKIKSRGYGNYPILIAENGIADKDDQHRPQFIYEHLKVFLETCQKLNLAPMGYLHWSLIDNFEWDEGFFPRFGLFSVDYETQKRTPTRSAAYFKTLGEQKILIAP